MPSIDLYGSFRSPYSYLATPGATKLARDFDVTIEFRPVLPLAVRDPDFFKPDNMKRARYIGIDWARRAEMLGMFHGWPSPDPIVQDMSSGSIAKDQPFIHRLTHLGVEAQRRGHGLPFAKEVSHVIFGGVPGWNEGSHLAEAADRAGLDLADMEKSLVETSDHAAEVESNQRTLEEAGHWGVPTFVYNGEPFFGEDRIETLAWRLEQHGVARRG